MNQDPLNLSRLPPLYPPADLWPAIQQQIKTPRRSSRPRWMPALAAALALGVIFSVLMHAPQPTPEIAPDPIRPSAILTAMTQSANLEAALRERQQGGVSTEVLEHLLLLETELFWVDTRLAERPENLALWQERSELLAAMVLSYAEPIEFAFRPANHL